MNLADADSRGPRAKSQWPAGPVRGIRDGSWPLRGCAATRRLPAILLSAAVAFTAAGALGGGTGNSAVSPSEAAPFRTDRLWVLPRGGAPSSPLTLLHGRMQARVVRSFPALGGLQVVAVPRHVDFRQAHRAYAESSWVAYVEPDFLVHAASEPNDPLFVRGDQWALHNTGQNGGVADADIDAPEAWDLQCGASNVVVAVIDSGVWLTHEDLAANLWRNPGEVPGNGVDDDGNGFVDDVHGLNATAGNGKVGDGAGHGTHLAGIIGAVGNNGLGVAGVAWRVQIMACRFLASDGSGSISDAVTCIEYARTMGARIINASWVGTNDSVALSLAVARARDAGILFVAAAGNSALDIDRSTCSPPNLPYENVLSVGASSRADTLWDRSNYGATNVDLAAPGLDISSTYFIADNNYVAMTGSSQAAAFVSGAAALVWAAFPAADYLEVISRIRYGTDPVPALRGRCQTGGRLNLRMALDPASFVVWPRIGLVTQANLGSPLDPDHHEFVLLNRGSAPVPWSVRTSETWVRTTPAEGVLGAGEKTSVLAALTPEALAFPHGHYTNFLQITGAGLPEPMSIPWTLDLYPPAVLRLVSAVPGQPLLHLNLTGQPHTRYAAQISANLLVWRDVVTNTVPAEGILPLFWSDPGTNARRYFRARVLGTVAK